MKGYIIRGEYVGTGGFGKHICFYGKGGKRITDLVYGGKLTMSDVYDKKSNAQRKRRILEKSTMATVKMYKSLDDLMVWSVEEVEWGC